MKINVTFDLTPEEFRQAMGLPDVQEFQQEFLKVLLEKMQKGEDGLDSMALYQSMLQGGMNSATQFQNLFFSMLAGKDKK
ncbi:MAG: hypothetical protein RL217_1434 [Pseudomonadota bacterium]|jgi:hypothetical protein